MTEYNNPVKVIHSNDWIIDLNNQLTHLNILNHIIVTSPGNKARLNLEKHFNKNSIYSFKGSNPTFDDCKRAIDYCQSQTFDSVIAIGGGSPMDLAKVVMAYLGTDETNILRLIEYENSITKMVPSIFIPTTHGTGSEVTMWGTVWNMVKKKKYSISHSSLFPTVAILDGNLTTSLPIETSIITILDALSHSFEAIWNKNANDVSTSYAIDAITLILKNIDFFKKDPSNLEIRKKLLLASNKAGLAFSNTTTAAAHSISYPLTIYYGIPHGVAASITLIPLLDINRSSIKEPLNILCNNLGLGFNELKEKILSIPNSIIPFKLTEWGVKKEDYPRLVKESFTKGRIDNNIVKLGFSQINEIFQKIY
jgi:alcohol dehydrogenase class IV